MIEIVLTKILLKEPFYGHILSRITKIVDPSVDKLKITPKLKLRYNRDWFENLNEDHQYGVILHELLHLILKHHMRRGERETGLWAAACDIVVNQYIDQRYRNPGWLDIEIAAMEFGIKIEYYQSAEFYYDILKSRNIYLKGDSTSSEALIQLTESAEFTTDLIDDESLSVKELSFYNKLLTNAVSENLDSTGKDFNFIRDLYNDDLIDWQDILKKFLAHKGRREKRKSWKRPSRRFELNPGNRYEKGSDVLIALDESGSMADETIKICIDELRKIHSITGVKLDVVRFDTECSVPVPLRDFIQETKRMKQGQTDFTPIFNLADEMKIPSVVIFTDGRGICPGVVNQRVLWLLTDSGEAPADFGERLCFMS